MGQFLEHLKEKLHSNPSSTSPHIAQHNVASPQDTAVNSHNTARTPKSCPPVTWDEKLAADATAYAQQLANEDKLHHSGVQGQGENLYWSSEGDATFDDAVQMWLKESEKYHGEKIGEGTLSDYGHYSMCLVVLFVGCDG